MSSCTPTAPGQRTRPPGALPARGDDNRVPRTRNLGAVADYRRTVTAQRGNGHTWIGPCRGDVFVWVSGWHPKRPRLRLRTFAEVSGTLRQTVGLVRSAAVDR